MIVELLSVITETAVYNTIFNDNRKLIKKIDSLSILINIKLSVDYNIINYNI